MIPLRCRVLSALDIGPMSIGQIGKALWADPHYVQQIIADLRRLGVVSHAGSERRGNWRPEKIWRLS